MNEQLIDTAVWLLVVAVSENPNSATLRTKLEISLERIAQVSGSAAVAVGAIRQMLTKETS